MRRQVRDLYQIDQLPIFQNRMYDTESAAKTCPNGDVKLVQDLQTRLVYNEAFRPELMQYDKHYQNEQAVSSLFRRHLEHVAVVIERAIGKRSVVEVGCGKGYFLETLTAKGTTIFVMNSNYRQEIKQMPGNAFNYIGIDHE